jgi:hypothetical protein
LPAEPIKGLAFQPQEENKELVNIQVEKELIKKQSMMTSLCEENSVEESIRQKPFAVHV